MNKLNLLLITALSVILLSTGFCAGWFLHKELKPCAEIQTDTIEVMDPYWHHIADSLVNLPPKEKIKWLPQDTLFTPIDTIALLNEYLSSPPEVDSLEIFKKFYSVYKYKWEKSDSVIIGNVKTPLIDIVLNTVVTQNMPIKYELDYKIRRPFETINNVVNNYTVYNKYVQFGLAVPVYSYNNLSKINLQDLIIEGSLVTPKGYLGVGWQPTNELLTARVGLTLFKFKQIK